MSTSDFNQPPAATEQSAGASGENSAGESNASRTLSSMLSTPRSRSRRWAVRGIIAATAALLLGTLLVGWWVQRSMRDLTGKSMETVLAANVSSLDSWLRERCDDVQRLSRDDAFLPFAKSLLSEFGDQDDLTSAELNEQAENEAAARLSRAVSGDRYLGWVLLDARSRIIASWDPRCLGGTISLPADVMPRLVESQATVSRPFKLSVPVASAGPLSQSGTSVMVAVAPISEGARLVGSLGLLVDPLGEFTQLLQDAPLGETGETYAFDRNGLMLSRSRFEDQLRKSGLLASDKNVPSSLNTYVRDPGVDIRYHSVDPSSIRSASLTWMADQATRGATGSTVNGYRNYRGVRVIGSWNWMHDFGMGVVTEIDYAEACAPMQIMKQAFYSLLGLISLIGVGLMTGLSVIRWVNRKGTAGTRQLGQYKLGSVVGQGGMGAVYRGRHELLDRDVAIKVLESTEVTTRTLTRFGREVRMTARLRHPNTIDIYDYGRTDDGTFYYVMEYIHGISLQALIRHYGRQPAERVIFLLLQICGSLSEAHKQGLVHRDVKPANVLLTTQAGLYDMVKVLDFGLVKRVRREQTQLTQNAAITGTPLYMSPESVRDASQANPQSDVYSVGAVGYFLLTGLPTFDGDSAADICVKQLHQRPLRCDQRLGQPLPDDLQNILMSCLRKDPVERPASMDELAEALMQCKNAHAWTPVDACQWWEQVYDGPRDERDDFADNESPRSNHPSSTDLNDNLVDSTPSSTNPPQSNSGTTTQ